MRENGNWGGRLIKKERLLRITNSKICLMKVNKKIVLKNQGTLSLSLSLSNLFCKPYGHYQFLKTRKNCRWKMRLWSLSDEL